MGAEQLSISGMSTAQRLRCGGLAAQVERNAGVDAAVCGAALSAVTDCVGPMHWCWPCTVLMVQHSVGAAVHAAAAQRTRQYHKPMMGAAWCWPCTMLMAEHLATVSLIGAAVCGTGGATRAPEVSNHLRVANAALC
jgi:hypothetical protein